MSFLKIQDEQKRLLLQIKGFVSDTYLEFAADKLGLSLFKLPEFNIDVILENPILIHNKLRLGNRLERFFAYIIHASESYDLLAENIQIIQDKITLGEIDFILLNKYTKQVLHVELCGKLYLYNPVYDNELHRWIGPNKKDSLLKKLNKLKDKQLPLLYHPETANMLSIFNFDIRAIEQQVCFKARLFMPYRLKDHIPRFVNRKNIKGYYLRLQEFLELNWQDNAFFMPEKQDWIVAPKYGEIWYSFDEILLQIEVSLLHKQSPMLWMKKPDGSYETLFVVWW